MIKLHSVDFAEIADEPGVFPRLRDCISDTPQPDEDKIIADLHHGVGLSGRSGYLRDVLDPSKGYCLTASTFTDGCFVWTTLVTYYVTKYHAKLPAEFVSHMKANNWTPPDKGSIGLDELSID